MGKIDLDDTDHVVASASLISVAQKAERVGDAAANVIDLDASYSGDIASDYGSRPELPVRRKYLYEGQLQRGKLCYQQRRGENNHRPGLLNIQLTKKFSVEDSIRQRLSPSARRAMWRLVCSQVGATGDLNTAITEWTAFDDDGF